MKSVALLMILVASATASAQSRITTGNTSPFLGGIPSGTVTNEPLTLTVVDAINRGLEHNLGRATAEDNLDRAKSARLLALAELLPNINGRLAETRQVINLAAFGFTLEGVPSIVGPFNVFDARVRASQSVLDFKALNDARAQQHGVAAAEYNVKSARDLIVLVSANAYLQALASSARSEAAAAQAAVSDALFQQATRMKDAGIVAGIDVLRAEVQLGADRQRATAAQNDYEKSKLQLARVIGLPLGQTFNLVSELPYIPAPDITLDQALTQAYETRPDYRAALERVKQAELLRSAAAAERLPSVEVNADYGALGLTPSDARATYAITGAVVVPLFNGGRTSAHIAQAEADLRERRSEADDMKAGVYYDVRSAFLDLQATKEQLDVAERGRTLAAQQLTQSRDRFAAGVASSVEIVQAQQAVAESSEQYISALYGYNVAKALLARGIGIAEQAARQYLGGIRQ